MINLKPARLLTIKHIPAGNLKLEIGVDPKFENPHSSFSLQICNLMSGCETDFRSNCN